MLAPKDCHLFQEGLGSFRQKKNDYINHFEHVKCRDEMKWPQSFKLGASNEVFTTPISVRVVLETEDRI